MNAPRRPAHVVALRAAVLGLAGGLAAFAVGVGYSVLRTTIPLMFLQWYEVGYLLLGTVVSSAACVLAEESARRVRPAWRVFTLVSVAAVTTVLIAAAVTWLDGVRFSGIEGGLRAHAELVDDAFESARATLGLIAAGLVGPLALAAARVERVRVSRQLLAAFVAPIAGFEVLVRAIPGWPEPSEVWDWRLMVGLAWTATAATLLLAERPLRRFDPLPEPSSEPSGPPATDPPAAARNPDERDGRVT